MLNFFAWAIVIMFGVPIMVTILSIFFATIAGSFENKDYRDASLEEGYVVMPDGTVRFDYEEYV